MTLDILRLPSFNDFSPELMGHDIRQCLRVVVDLTPNESAIFKEWARLFFKGVLNKRATTNLPATLRSTGLSTGERPIRLSEVGTQVLAASSSTEAARIFCRHLILEKNGKFLIEALTHLKSRNERVTKASLKQELTGLGISHLAPGTTDHTTLKNWLIHAGLVNRNGEPIDIEIKALLGISAGEMAELKRLTLGQQIFLKKLRVRHELESGPFPTAAILQECLEEFPSHFDESQFAKRIRLPLESAGWLIVEGLAGGVHGGKSGKISATKKLLEIPMSEVIPDFDRAVPGDLRDKLNTPLESIALDLIGKDTHKAGIALELLSLRAVLDLGLEPKHFRLRSAQSAGAEVDLVAEGSHLLFSRWVFQCKRYGPGTSSKMRLSDLAKEVGIAIYLKAHVIVMVTTSDFTQDAKEYAREITRDTPFQFVLLNGDVVREYLKSGKDVLRAFFHQNARSVMNMKSGQAGMLPESPPSPSDVVTTNGAERKQATREKEAEDRPGLTHAEQPNEPEGNESAS